MRRGEYDKAVKLYEELYLARPEEESILLRLAWANYDRGATAEAIAYLEILLQRELQRKIFTGFAFDELVRIYKQEKNYVRLTEICRRAVEQQPEDIGLLIELGNAFLKSGNDGEACLIYEKAVRMENDNPALYCLWGEALFAAGRPQESEAAYLQAGKLDPEQLDRYYFKIAELFAKRGGYNDAQRLLEMCIAVSPSQPVYHCCAGDAFIGLGRIAEALMKYETAVTLDNSGSGAYYNRLGNSLTRAGYHKEAAAVFRKAMERESDNPAYARHLALACKNLGVD